MAPERKYINDSLLITPELCSHYKACGQGMAYMERFYPQGFTVDDVYNHRVRHIPMHFVSWGFHYLPFTDKDREKYLEFAKVIDCTSYFCIFKCEHCNHIDYSNNCEHSDWISNSQNVVNSFQVGHSKIVQESQYVFSSEEIYDCYGVNQCKRAVSCKYARNSDDITNCYAVSDCKDLRDCLYLEDVETADRRILSKGKNIKNRIFCTEDCPPYEYAFLNKEVSKAKFDVLFNDISELLLEEPLSENLIADFSRKPKATKILFAEGITKVLPRLVEILPSLTKEDKMFLFKLSLCSELLK